MGSITASPAVPTVAGSLTVTALFFASYADALGRDALPVTLDAPATVADVVARVRALPGGHRVPAAPMTAVNAAYARGDRVLVAGDEVAFIPPVAGGDGIVADGSPDTAPAVQSSGQSSVQPPVRTAIVERPLDAAALLGEVAAPGHGALALFVGTVREVNDGRAVTGIDYTAYVAMAERELFAVASEVASRCATAEGTPRIVAEHRLGTLGVGEASVVVAVGHARRGPAMDAVRDVVEELKRRVPIWKREHYADGARAWVDPTGQAAPAAHASGPSGASLADSAPVS